MKNYIKLIRVKHWIKNILIFVPMIFSKQINLNNILTTFIGFFAFSFVASFIYIINDIRDVEKDRLHEAKKNRPIASGKISVKKAIVFSVLIIGLAVILSIFASKNYLSLIILGIYLIINMYYSFGGKNIAIVDVILLAAGFVLRVYYGASLINVNVSDWLFLTVLNASLFLGFGKRKKELLNSKNSRGVLKFYNENFINQFMYLCLGLTIVFYSLWAIEYNYMVITIPVLMTIFMQYSLLLETNTDGDPITLFYKSPLLIISAFIYSILMFILLVVL